jgi:molecular chaperone GrpE
VSDSKGPKVSLPEELRAELEESPSQEVGEELEEAAEPEVITGEEEDSEAGDLPMELEELNEKYLRLAAEFENFKRRALKERQELHNFANENLIKELLPTVDNLERAVGHARQEDGGDAKNLLEGIELTYRSLMQALEKLGVEGIDPEGEPFDPKLHEAIRQVSSDEHGTGVVMEVFQKGYLLKNRLIRAALVAVSSGTEGTSE